MILITGDSVLTHPVVGNCVSAPVWEVCDATETASGLPHFLVFFVPNCPHQVGSPPLENVQNIPWCSE